MPKCNTFISTASHIGNISEPPVRSVNKHPNIMSKAARLTPEKIIFHPCEGKFICNTFIFTFEFECLRC